jgi:dipeptidyl aminopeptidase/acylaminoacyl peptidase
MPDLTATLPSALRESARWARLGREASIPAMLVHPTWDESQPAPVVLWIHGRTVTKETDPGRYLRWMRAGIGVCAIDLPGHGERYDESKQSATTAWEVLTQAYREIDVVVEALRDFPAFDDERTAIGGMSLGGMAALARLTRPHSFRCATVEATTGSWARQKDREMFRNRVAEETRALEPILHLEHWREIPLQALHARHDEWVSFEGQQEFIDALLDRYADPSLIDFIIYEETGAPHEHIGFGRKAADAKSRQTAFLRRWLLEKPGTPGNANPHPSPS